MTPPEIETWLARTLDDRRLSRNERQVLTGFVADLASGADRREVVHRAFRIAREALEGTTDPLVLDWLEDVVKAVREDEPESGRRGLAEAHFSPGDDCLRTIRRLLADAMTTADVCVFTITDDRIAAALLDAHRRGVAVRIITDDSKADDLGSDADRLAGAGIPVRVDRSPFHMHHKFAILDGSALLTGSYNWTVGAARDNEENVIVTDDPRLVAPFATTFARLWEALGRESQEKTARTVGRPASTQYSLPSDE